MKYLLILICCSAMISCKKEAEKASEIPYELKIAYNVLYDADADDFEVFSMNLDGSDKQNITNFKGVEWTYYAYDDMVYFVTDKDTAKRNYQLYKMKADGSEKTRISDMRLMDSWHGSRNNASELIVTPHSTVDSAFYILDENGKLLNKIKPDLTYFSDPSFSPDGKHIAFRGAHYPSKRDSLFVDEIYVMNDDGTNLRQLTHYPKTDTTAKWYAYKAGPPKWHPTENFISYSSFQDGKYSLFGVTLDGTKQWKLTNNDVGEVFHDWSPDGKWLVTDLDITEEETYHIGLINWETKEKTILTDSTYQYHQSPVFVKVYD